MMWEVKGVIDLEVKFRITHISNISGKEAELEHMLLFTNDHKIETRMEIPATSSRLC